MAPVDGSRKLLPAPVQPVVFTAPTTRFVVDGAPAQTATGAAPRPAPPDLVRAKVRTAAQAFWGFVWALLARWAAQELGLDLPDQIPGELVEPLSAASVALFAVVWMWVVGRVSRVAPWFERVFVLRGAPVYVETPRAGRVI